MLFLVNNSGVPSVAKWVSVRGQDENGACTDITPAKISSLSALEVGRESVKLTWTSPGGNGSCGTVAKYDVRRRTTAITESNFYDVQSISVSGPTPDVAGSPQCMEVDDLTVCTTYHFAIKTRDAQGAWSKISNVVSAQTNCSGYAAVFCDGGGLFGGGEGGGGGSARQMGLSSAGPMERLTGNDETDENSLLWPGSGPGDVDLHLLGRSLAENGGQYAVRLRQAGSWQAAVDQLSLGVVDYDPGIVAIAGKDRVLLGTTAPVASVTDAVGREVPGLQAGPADQPSVMRAGQHVVVRMRGPSATTALVIESRGAAARVGEDTGGILVQETGPAGAWVTITEVHPRRKFDRIALATGASESIRLLFLRPYSLQSLAQMNIAGTVLPQPLALATARHSRLGGVEHAVDERGGASTSLAPGDSLSLAFTATTKAPEMVRDIFLMARGSYETVREEGSTELAGAAPAGQATWAFGVGPARPNPSFGKVSIDFTVARRVPVNIRVYDVAGRLVSTLVNQELPAGLQTATWDGRDDEGRKVGAGVYFYRMIAGDWHSERKLMLVQR